MYSVPVRAPLYSRKYWANRPSGPSAQPAWLPAGANKSLCPAVSSGNPRRAGVCRGWVTCAPNASPISPKMGRHQQGLQCYPSSGARRDTGTRFLCNVASAHSLGYQAPTKTKIDLHKKTAVITIMITKPDGTVEQHTQTFSTMISDLLALDDWLRAHGVEIVAMEATGIYTPVAIFGDMGTSLFPEPIRELQ